uniref:Syntaxin N-terminal domain-containing protein n=1 Tax=Timema cristinae TaxID=61476 RepID=A0A7R9D038_TIMCR|nr:unnamed protein product [Timema cristinae]
MNPDLTTEVEDSRPLAGTIPIYTRSVIARCAQFLVLNPSESRSPQSELWTGVSKINADVEERISSVQHAIRFVRNNLQELSNGAEQTLLSSSEPRVRFPECKLLNSSVQITRPLPTIFRGQKCCSVLVQPLAHPSFLPTPPQQRWKCRFKIQIDDTTALTRIKIVQHSTLSKLFMEAIQEYNSTLVRHRERCANLLKQQILITDKTVNYEELQELLDREESAIFVDNWLVYLVARLCSFVLLFFSPTRGPRRRDGETGTTSSDIDTTAKNEQKTQAGQSAAAYQMTIGGD